MRYRVVLRGVPLGDVELPDRELATGILAPLPGFDSVSSVVVEGSRALLALGFFGSAVRDSAAIDTSATKSAQNALERAAALELELRDGFGAIVPTTFVNVIVPPDDSAPLVIARFRDVHARVPAILPRDAGTPGASESPDV